MSAPYLNRGESIILTTHRVSAGSVMYDALLTNERLILMDSRYTRFEPRMIHFPSIMSVKGGKVPTGEPVIILILDKPDETSGSEQLDLIFTQQPGEHRMEERETWVRKIIDLVITEREQSLQAPVKVRRKTGMHPTVRRWVAPEPARPHTSVKESAPPARRVVAIPEETDLPSFNRADLPPVPEGPPPAGETGEAPEEEPETPLPSIPAGAEPEVTAREVPADDALAVVDVIPDTEPPSVPEDRILELLYEESAGTPSGVVQENTPAEPGEPSASFAGTIQSALHSLQSRDADRESPEARTPVRIEQGEPTAVETPEPATPSAETRVQAEGKEEPEDRGMPGHQDLPKEPARADLEQPPGAGQGTADPEPAGEVPVPHPVHVPEPGEEPEPPRHPPADEKEQPVVHGIPDGQATVETPPVPGATGLHDDHTADPLIAVKTTGESRGIPAPAPRHEPQGYKRPTVQSGSRDGSRSPVPERTFITTITIVIIAMLVLSMGIILVSQYLKASDGKIPVIEPSAITVTRTPVPVMPVTSPSGVRVDVIYPGLFTGKVGNPGNLQQVSGTGNRTFTVLMTTGIVQATIQKQDNSGNALTVGIYNNSTLLAEKTVTAPMGEINLLIDTATSNAPGMESLSGGNTTRAGNVTLVDY